MIKIAIKLFYKYHNKKVKCITKKVLFTKLDNGDYKYNSDCAATNIVFKIKNKNTKKNPKPPSIVDRVELYYNKKLVYVELDVYEVFTYAGNFVITRLYIPKCNLEKGLE